jgi:hypothetical protein
LLDQLVGGTWTAVYRAKREGSEADYLITLCGGQGCPDDHPFRARFRSIASKAPQVQHPSLPRVTDHGSEQGWDFMVWEDLRAKALAQILADRGKLSLSQAIDVVLKVAEGVAEAARAGLADATAGIETVAVTPDQQVRLTGILNREESPAQPWETEFRASPEKAPADSTHNRALAAMLYHLVTGRPRERHKWCITEARTVDFDARLRALPQAARETLAALMASDAGACPDLAAGLAALKRLREAVPDTSAEDLPLVAPEGSAGPALKGEALETPPTAVPTSEAAAGSPQTTQEAEQEAAAGVPWLVVGMFLLFVAIIYWVYVYFHVKGDEKTGGYRGGVGQVEEWNFTGSPAWQYADVVQRTSDLRDAEHFGDAMKLLDQFAERQPGTEWARYAQEEKQRLREVAFGCYERVKSDVQRLRSFGKTAEAQSLLDHVIRQYGIPELVEEAKKEKGKLGETGTPPGDGPGATTPIEKPAEPGSTEAQPEAGKPAEPTAPPPPEPTQPAAPQ